MSRGKKRKQGRGAKKRHEERQDIKVRYTHAREDAQLAGLIPTAPEEALKSERVNPADQVDPLRGLPAIVRQALRDNWATPDTAKSAVVAALLRSFFNDVTVIDKDGKVCQVPPSPKLLLDLARTLQLLDQTQFERDHPEEAGKARGGGTSVSVQTNVAAAALIREMIEKGELSAGGVPEELPPSPQSSALSNS